MKLRTIGFISTLALGLLAGPLPAEAQQAGKVPRIGVLPSRVCSPVMLKAFEEGLGELGYVDGQNIAIECRSPEGKPERLPDVAAELVRLKVDLIFAIGTPATRAAINATRTIPVVFPLVADPVGQGFITSLSRPGRNATGLSSMLPELSGKQLELLKEAVPGIVRVGVLVNPTTSYAPIVLRETKRAARSLGLQLRIVEVRDPEGFESAFSAMTRERADALLVLADAMFFVHRKRLAYFAAKSRLPTMHGLRQHAEAGDLMAYSADFTDLFRRAATYVDKILRGANPADLPVERPTKFELIINLKTAKQLGITIPPSILYRADKVIK